MLITALFLLSIFSGSWLIGSSATLSDAAAVDSALVEQPGFDALQETWGLIVDQYVDQEAIVSDELLYGAAGGMVEALGDYGHSAFLDPQETEIFNSQQHGKLIGIGVQLDTTGRLPVIVMTIAGSPAAIAGLLAGDVITQIDGVSVNGLTPEEVRTLMRGDAGATVSLTIERPGELQKFPVVLTRAEIELDPVEFAMLPDGIALIRINEFSDGAGVELQGALEKAMAAGAAGIIIDLRDNPGGYVHEARAVASLLLPAGKILFQQQERGGETSSVTTTGNDGLAAGLPIVALINGDSASAAEILAASLRENGRATLVGETTFGTGTILSPFPLDDGSTVLLGTAQWLTPTGKEIWKKGVEADVEVALDAPADILRPAEDAIVTDTELLASADAQMQMAQEMIVTRGVSGAGTGSGLSDESHGAALTSSTAQSGVYLVLAMSAVSRFQ